MNSKETLASSKYRRVATAYVDTIEKKSVHYYRLGSELGLVRVPSLVELTAHLLDQVLRKRGKRRNRGWECAGVEVLTGLPDLLSMPPSHLSILGVLHEPLKVLGRLLAP